MARNRRTADAEERRNYIAEALGALETTSTGNSDLMRYQRRSTPPEMGVAMTGAPAPGPAFGTGDPDRDEIIRREVYGPGASIQDITPESLAMKAGVKNQQGSSAFGIGQIIRKNRERLARRLGIEDPDTTDYKQQLSMMDAYVTERYGSYKKAREFWEKNGWY